MFALNSPFFQACWDGDEVCKLIAAKFVPRVLWVNYERMLFQAIANHGWPQIEQFVLDERWARVKKKAKKMRNVGEVRQAFEAMLLAGEVEAAYRFVGRGCEK